MSMGTTSIWATFGGPPVTMRAAMASAIAMIIIS